MATKNKLYWFLANKVSEHILCQPDPAQYSSWLADEDHLDDLVNDIMGKYLTGWDSDSEVARAILESVDLDTLYVDVMVLPDKNDDH